MIIPSVLSELFDHSIFFRDDYSVNFAATF